jgi:hypothetical protein
MVAFLVGFAALALLVVRRRRMVAPPRAKKPIGSLPFRRQSELKHGAPWVICAGPEPSSVRLDN